MQSRNLSMEVYNDLQQFKRSFNSLLDEDRSDPSEVEGQDFDLETFLDESWADWAWFVHFPTCVIGRE